jgi:CheY-like chemotaxis protein
VWSDRKIASKNTAKFATLNVLLVDDHPNIRSILTAILNALGIMRVTAVDGGQVALDQMATANFDLIITDLDMPGMTGREMVKAIRRDARAVVPTYDFSIPILMITGNITRSILNEARDIGIDEILAKPFSAASVSERLSAVLNNRREFIVCDTYIGPCRRRGANPTYKGPMRRDTDLDELPPLEIEYERLLVLEEAKSLCRFAQFGDRLGVAECESVIATAISVSQRANRMRDPILERAASSLVRFVQTAASSALVTSDIVEVHGYAIIELLDATSRDETIIQRVLSGLEAAVDKRLHSRSAA